MVQAGCVFFGKSKNIGCVNEGWDGVVFNAKKADEILGFAKGGKSNGGEVVYNRTASSDTRGNGKAGNIFDVLEFVQDNGSW